jgi:hypothetical protein
MLDLECQTQKKKAETTAAKPPTMQDLDRSIPWWLRNSHPQILPRANHGGTQLLHSDHSGVLRLNPSQGCFMARDHALDRSQPGLRTSQRRLRLDKADLTPAQHRFRHPDKPGGMTGNLLDRRQRPVSEATNFIPVPGGEIIADEQRENAYRDPVCRFFENHMPAPDH